MSASRLRAFCDLLAVKVLVRHQGLSLLQGVRDLDGVPIGNPGSEYSEGVLGGLLIEFDERHGLVNTSLVRG